MLIKSGKVFISYDHSDSEYAASLRQAFRAEGLDVWWDDELHSGQHWAEVLDDQLSRVKAVVALWSKDSVKSDWVRHEASIGKMRGVLTHASIDDTVTPAPFSSVQLTDLSNWNRKESDANFRKLVESIKAVSRRQLRKTFMRIGVFVALLAVPFALAWTVQSQRIEVLQEVHAEKKQGYDVWRARVPVRLRTDDNKAQKALYGELQQVQIEIQPPLAQASANEVEFWVIHKTNEKFPTVTFTIPTISLKPETLDLNDPNSMIYDPDSRVMTGIAPVWLTVGSRYQFSSQPGGG